MDRLQRRYAFISIKLDTFQSMQTAPKEKEIFDEELVSQPPAYDRSTVSVNGIEVLYQESVNDGWLNVYDGFRILSQISESENSSGYTRMILVSEKSGYPQLYLVESQFSRYRIRPLASGTYCVIMEHPIEIDEENEFVYFLAKTSCPTRTDLCRVSYRQSDTPNETLPSPEILLRHKDWSITNFHSLFSSSKSIDKVIVCWSSCIHGIRWETHHIAKTGSSIITGGPSKIDVDPTRETGVKRLSKIILKNTVNGFKKSEYFNKDLITVPLNEDIPKPIFFEFLSADGITNIHGSYYLPENHISGKKYPTILCVYNGPQVQLVSKELRLARLSRYWVAVKLGFLVVFIDGRGSANRGVQFEQSILNGKLGQMELDDQLRGLDWLSAHKGLIDVNRICIQGWSYGTIFMIIFFKLCRWIHVVDGFGEVSDSLQIGLRWCCRYPMGIVRYCVH